MGLKILPVVRSTENLFLNKTDWDRFAGDTGVRLDRLSTWEGVAETAKAYYEWSGERHFWALTAWPTTSLLRPCRQEMIFISCRTAR